MASLTVFRDEGENIRTVLDIEGVTIKRGTQAFQVIVSTSHAAQCQRQAETPFPFPHHFAQFKAHVHYVLAGPPLRCSPRARARSMTTKGQTHATVIPEYKASCAVSSGA